MTAPAPGDPPLTGAGCSAWAQPHQLPADVQELHPVATLCSYLALATDVLWAATGRRWRGYTGSDTVTLDAAERACPPLRWWTPAWHYGPTWPFFRSLDCPHKVRLPRPDVTAITAVTLRGASFVGWRREGNWAVRTDGLAWPLGDGAASITYDYGRSAPAAGVRACALLAAELAKAGASRKCALPARTTSVAREGVSFELIDPREFLDDGLTGLLAVDLWIKAVNPHGTRQAAQVWSPDLTTARRA